MNFKKSILLFVFVLIITFFQSNLFSNSESIWSKLPYLYHAPKALRTKEEFYRLYYLRIHHDNTSYLHNIKWLLVALKKPFDKPIKALVIAKNPDQYREYQKIINFHLNFLIAKNYLLLAASYDKFDFRWFDLPYSKWIEKSLKIADYYYRCAQWYWEESLKIKANFNDDIENIDDIVQDLHYIGNTVTDIDNNRINYSRVIQRRVNKNKDILNQIKQYYQIKR